MCAPRIARPFGRRAFLRPGVLRWRRPFLGPRADGALLEFERVWGYDRRRDGIHCMAGTERRVLLRMTHVARGIEQLFRETHMLNLQKVMSFEALWDRRVSTEVLKAVKR